jgi:uncharacterized protein YbaR (Trm112 family)
MIHNIVVCPITKEKLQLAPEEIVRNLNSKIEKKIIKNRGGTPLSYKLGKALVNKSRTLLYPVVSEIPLLLPDNAIELDAIESNTSELGREELGPIKIEAEESAGN